MYIEGFDWDDDNIAHIARHDVEPEEVKEVFYNEPLARHSRDGCYIALACFRHQILLQGSTKLTSNQE